MKNKPYEIWMHEKKRTWEIYTSLTDAVRKKLCLDGWTFVLCNETVEDIIEREFLEKNSPEKDRSNELNLSR